VVLVVVVVVEVVAVRAWTSDGAGHVRRADPIAVRDRRQPLHRRAQQPAERLRLRLTQLRELG
jgi:hypothetical protein